MIQALTIDNYALIDHLDITFQAGFSVVTGETGSGKSIILGALGLLLGERCDAKTLRNAEKKCVIEGTFDVSKYDFQAFFEENELDYESQCIIRREILVGGKSRAFVNDTPVNVSVLKTLGEHLIDIHSQHKNLLLSNKEFQFNVVDTVANAKMVLADYRRAFREWKATERKIQQLQETASQENSDLDYLNFQYTQLTEAKLTDVNEQTELEAENETLSHVEEIKTALCKTCAELSSEENGVLLLLKDVRKTLSGISSVFPKAEAVLERVESNLIDLKDLASELETENDRCVYDPQRAAFVTDRLNTIFSLEQKHRVNSVAELMALRDEMGNRLASINNYDEQLATLNKCCTQQQAEAKKLATQLTKLRQMAAPTIESSVCANLVALGMPNAQLKIQITEGELHENGEDMVEILFSANKNVAVQDIARIASGGEIARVMLCIKALLSGQAGIATIIFDEIDTGVSGEIANKMGCIMQEMGKSMQVISITHLPQIATKGSAHYKVFKLDTDSATQTQIVQLSPEERIMEVAQMLSGKEPTAAAIENAKDLLGA